MRDVMKYTLTNEHSNVNFHDARVNGVCFQGNHMIWELVALQTQNIVQEVHDNNCYIKHAVMVLENARIENIVIGGVSVASNEYDIILKNISYKNFSYIYGITDLPHTVQGQYKIGIMAGYEIIVAFTKSIITWNEFCGVEWYRNKLWSNEYPN